VIRWRQILSFLLCAAVLSGSVSGAHLHICGHDDDVPASLQVHTPHHLELHLAHKGGASDLDVELLAGVLKKLEQRDAGSMGPGLVLLMPTAADGLSLSWPSGYPPGPAGRPPRVLPPLRAPPHSLPA
jgi:hypothetical protein